MERIPQVPRPGTTRGRWLARERADDSRGRFHERFLQFNFAPIAPPGFQSIVQPVTSQGARHVRCLKFRGTTTSNQAFTGLEPGLLALRLQINGDNDLVGGNANNFASFASLFDEITTPWFTFVSPPLLRTGDLLTATVANLNAGEGAPTLTPEVSLVLMDDDLWQELYTRDWRKERRA